MTRGNVAWEMNEMSKGRALNSTSVSVMFQTSQGIVMCASLITATATLSALCESQGIKFAPGCLHHCCSTNAVATVLEMVNYGTTASAPTWYASISTGVAV